MDKIAASIAKVLGEAMSEAIASGHDLPSALSDALDAWIADQPDPKPSRPDAIRAVLTAHLTATGYLR
ncbi:MULTISPECIES: hypothetical protein [Methylobacterium]|jgi:hypothetical protein|uniref:CopG family transcriptional regulator n=1 Tax=Methylobacterium longum TaxID=767694 RepID=A0ABT8AWL2_9HYPH|nr:MULTISPECIES: hypothetical protein [Methylobacterium]MCJ2103716.1 hypothetical protein [Methylobacterium sp. E-046]MDN3574307.1 hypothetical protein [Methylobacterium longum]GJE13362.1 hypothetical protein FOHLNKBM_4425 [Methylobacterium longum]